jgi:hypothetical protein
MRLATEAVRSHMRILTGVTGSLVVTTSPSEPILAIASAAALNASYETYRAAIVTLLDKLVLKGLVLDRSLQGELYTRLLLTLARDKAALLRASSFVTGNSGSGYKIEAVDMKSFLEVLLGSNLGLAPDQETLRKSFLKKMAGVWINFTHFVQLREPIDEIPSSMLLEAWSSCSAFQCAFNQPVIDGFLVAYRGDLHKQFNISNLIVIPWLTNAKSRPAEVAIAKQLTAPYILAEWKGRRPKVSRQKTEHLVILMDLGTSVGFGKAGPRTQLSYDVAEPPEESKWGGHAEPDEKEPKRYCLNIRGHSSEQYPVLAGFETQLDQLFQRSLVLAHPDLASVGEKMGEAIDRFKL